MIEKGILGGRVFVSRGEDYPCAVLSFLSYQPKEEAARFLFIAGCMNLLFCRQWQTLTHGGFQFLRRWRQKHGDEAGAEIFHLPKRDWRGRVIVKT